jgi:hypothetical protein
MISVQAYYHWKVFSQSYEVIKHMISSNHFQLFKNKMKNCQDFHSTKLLYKMMSNMEEMEQTEGLFYT